MCDDIDGGLVHKVFTVCKTTKRMLIMYTKRRVQRVDIFYFVDLNVVSFQHF